MSSVSSQTLGASATDSTRSVQAATVSFFQLKQVMEITTLGRTSIYRGVADGSFPRPRKIAPGRVAWLSTDLNDWMLSRPIDTETIPPPAD